MRRLKSLEVIEGKERVSSVDIFRALAIISVVVYHFNGFLPFGYLGVDLFFVISGLLVGGILIRKFQKNEQVNFFEFVLQRGFKIWPSYYWFLGLGTLLAYLFYGTARPDYIIDNLKDAIRYVFFFQNYTAGPSHWPFDHVWSLCIEEHFYLLLPLMIIFTMFLFGNKRSLLLLSVTGLIFTGIFFKMYSFYFADNPDAFTVSHKRIDGLGWGALLAVLITYYSKQLRKFRQLKYLFILGVLSFGITILLYTENGKEQYQGLLFTVTPFCFFLMVLGLYFIDFSKWKLLRFVSYYSYNWYLWHPIFVLICSEYVGRNIFGLVVYLLISFSTAMLFTVIIEENFLRIRESVVSRIFRKPERQIRAASSEAVR